MNRQSRIGIDVGGYTIKWAVVEDDRVVRDGSVPTPVSDQFAVLAAVVDLVRAQAPVAAAGVALPAVVDTDAGRTLMAPNLPGRWVGLAAGPHLETELGIPVTLCNDARAFTRAEWLLGAARGRRNVIGLTLGTGVGGGIVSDGRLVEGPRGQAGELGHLPVSPGGPRCGCGADGCLEAYAGARALVRNGKWKTAEAVAAAARAGDRRALALVQQAGDAIGHAVAFLATALNPEILVVGGGFAASLDLLRPRIEAHFRERAAFVGELPVVRGELGTSAGAIGAALWPERR